MEKYTIYCAEEQTRKALELGAPIKTISYDPPVPSPKGWVIYKGCCCKPPTAEQMLGWLEEQEIIDCVDVVYEEDEYVFYMNADEVYELRKGRYNSRKEATLAAIDAALEYLSNVKQSNTSR